MKVFERMGLLLRADAHGVMDQLEERRLLLKQLLREAENELAHKRARLESLEEEAGRVSEDAERLAAQVAAADADVEIALQGGDEELARFAVRRLLPKREALAELRARAERLEERRERLADRLGDQQTQLDALRTRVRAELAQAPRAAGSAVCGVAASGDSFGDAAVSDEEVELELLRRRASLPRPADATIAAKEGV